MNDRNRESRYPGRCVRCGSGQHGRMCTACGGKVRGREWYIYARGKGTRVVTVYAVAELVHVPARHKPWRPHYRNWKQVPAVKVRRFMG